MKNGKKINKKRLGFIVERQSDSNFIEYLHKAYFKDKFDVVIIPTIDKAALLSSSRAIASVLLGKGINHVFTMYDVKEESAEEHLEYLHYTLKRQGVDKDTTVIVVEPFIDSWILSGYVDDVEEIKSMNLKTQLDKLKSFGFEEKPFEFGQKQLDFSKMMKNKNFENFIHKVEERI